MAITEHSQKKNLPAHWNSPQKKAIINITTDLKEEILC